MVTEPVAVTTFPIGAVSRSPAGDRPGLLCACAAAGRPPPAHNSAAPTNTTVASIRMLLLAKRETTRVPCWGQCFITFAIGRRKRHLGRLSGPCDYSPGPGFFLIINYGWGCDALCELFHIVWQIVQP